MYPPRCLSSLEFLWVIPVFLKAEVCMQNLSVNLISKIMSLTPFSMGRPCTGQCQFGCGVSQALSDAFSGVLQISEQCLEGPWQG